MLKRLIMTLIVCVNVYDMANAQVDLVPMQNGEYGVYNNYSKKLNKKELTLEYNNIKGSPYYNDEFVKTVLSFKDGSMSKDTYMRLDLHKNNLQFEQGNEIYILSNLANISKITTENQEFAFIRDSKNHNLGTFFRVNVSGKNKFLSSLNVKFNEAVESSNTYSKDKEAEFRRAKEIYYIQQENGNLVRLKSKKQFNSSFSTYNEELITYVKEKKLNPSKYDDMVQIVTYMNRETKDSL